MTFEELSKFNRIDIQLPSPVTKDPVQVWFFEPKQFDKKDVPYKNYFEKELPWDMEAFLVYLESHGWHIRRWNGGARAFNGKPFSIRSAFEIKRLRSRLEEEARRCGGDHPSGNQIHTLELAYDL